MNYKDSGVDLHSQDMFNAKLCQKMPWLGGFGGAFDIGEDYLVSSTDGVGTKVTLYNTSKDLDGVDIKNLGIDLVAMVVNDIVCTGAKPLFFNDYLSVNNLESFDAMALIEGINEGLSQCGGIPLLGGETAIMGDMYKDGEFDIAGFAIGACPKDNYIDGSNIESGDVMLGLKSSGFHSNGYSLIRKVLDENADTEKPEGLIKNILTPTKIYVKTIMRLLEYYREDIHGISHITGGGRGNVNRLLGEDVNLRPHWNDNEMHFRPEEMNWIQKAGNIDELEMRKVFNNGIGMVLIVARNSAEKIIKMLQSLDEEVFEVGLIADRLDAEQLEDLTKTIENRH